MKSLIQLWLKALDELGAWCHTSTAQDSKTVLRRLESEGLSFLTITLPTFAKDFEKSLDLGMVPNDLFVGWKKSSVQSKETAIPLFLGGFLGRVFSLVDGRLVDKPDIDAIFAVRQLTLMYGKLQIPCSDARVKKAIEGYIDCEQEVRRYDAELSPIIEESFRKASLVMWGSVLQQVDEDVYYCRIIPKHGPGATADRLKGNHKFDQVEWTERLERVFPYGEYAVPNARYHSDSYSRVNFLEPGDERPVRVVTVPKTLKTPRIIAIEPTCMQYVQQGLMSRFVELMESPGTKKYPNPSYGLVGFTDQVPNQDMACIGSEDGTLATLDLSEASDRVSNQLVRTMVSNFPNLGEALDASRSRKADVPGYGVIRLAKFASMGSAMTFPIEAMVFSTVAMMGVASSLNLPLTAELVQEHRDSVRVYGDDIIVPTDCVARVMEYLETFGFKVNLHKSFWTGKFRESCGREFYDGQSVSIARVRQFIPTGLDRVEEVLSTVSLRNQFYQLGMWQTVGFLDNILQRTLRGHFPNVAEESPVLGRLNVSFGYETQKMHPTLHSPLVKGYVPSAKIPYSRISGLAALLKCLLKQGDEPFADSEHLQRGGRPDAVDIKLRWKQPF